MNRKTKYKLAASFFFAVFAISILQTGFSIQVRQARPALAEILDENDFVSFCDTELDNVSYTIEEEAAKGFSDIRYLSKVRIIGATRDYRILEFPEYFDALQMGSSKFLKEYWAFRKFTGLTGKELLSGKFDKQTLDADLRYRLSKFAAENDSASASGDNMIDRENWAIDDLDASSSSGEIKLNSSDWASWGTVESDYQKYADDLAGNSTSDDLYIHTEDVLDQTSMVAGFFDFGDAMKEVLRANIAANESTAADTIVPDRIVILDYTLNNTNVTDYLTATFTNEIRQVIDDYESGETAAIISMSLFGIVLTTRTGRVPFTFFYPPGLAQGRLSAPLRSTVGEVFKIAKTTVSKALPVLASAPAKIQQSIKSYQNKLVTNVKSKITKAQTTTRGVIQAALKVPQNIIKTVGGTAQSFVASAQRSVTDLVNATGKMISKPFTSIIGGLQRGVSYVTWAIVLGIVLVILVIGAVLVIKFVSQMPN